MLEPHESIWNEHLGPIAIANHKVKLDRTAKKPVNSVARPAGPKARDFEKDRIHNMISTNVIEPAETE